MYLVKVKLMLLQVSQSTLFENPKDEDMTVGICQPHTFHGVDAPRNTLLAVTADNTRARKH